MFAPALAFAHTGGVERSLALEASKDRLHVLAHVEVSGKRRIETWVRLVDVNHDGRLSKAERAELERRLVAQALDGIRVFVGSSTVAIEGGQSALKLERGQPIALMVHGSAPLPPRARDLAVTTRPGGAPLKLLVRPGTRPVVKASRGAPSKGGLSVEMKAADRVSWRIAGE
ncbi:MAG: hypothetical protein RIT81_26040 [Deltaproteobacteria bacterium]